MLICGIEDNVQHESSAFNVILEQEMQLLVSHLTVFINNKPRRGHL